MNYKKHTHTGDRAFRPILFSISFLLLSMFSSNSLFAQEIAVKNTSACDYWIRYRYGTTPCCSTISVTTGYILVVAGTTYSTTVPSGEAPCKMVVAPNVAGSPGVIFSNWDCTTGYVYATNNCGGVTDEVDNTGWSVKIAPQ